MSFHTVHFSELLNDWQGTGKVMRALDQPSISSTPVNKDWATFFSYSWQHLQRHYSFDMMIDACMRLSPKPVERMWNSSAAEATSELFSGLEIDVAEVPLTF